MSRKSLLQGVKYRPVGRGQQTRRAWVNRTILTAPRVWLEERLGPLALFESFDDNVEEARLPPATAADDTSASDAAGGNDAMHELGPLGGDLDPVRFAPPMMLMAPPHGIWRTANGIRIEEAADMCIVPNPDPETRSSSSVSIFRYSDTRLIPVALAWSSPRGKVVNDGPPQQNAFCIPPELLVLVHPQVDRFEAG